MCGPYDSPTLPLHTDVLARVPWCGLAIIGMSIHAAATFATIAQVEKKVKRRVYGAEKLGGIYC